MEKWFTIRLLPIQCRTDLRSERRERDPSTRKRPAQRGRRLSDRAKYRVDAQIKVEVASSVNRTWRLKRYFECQAELDR